MSFFALESLLAMMYHHQRQGDPHKNRHRSVEKRIIKPWLGGLVRDKGR